jgi:hypothetical protein
MQFLQNHKFGATADRPHDGMAEVYTYFTYARLLFSNKS